MVGALSPVNHRGLHQGYPLLRTELPKPFSLKLRAGQKIALHATPLARISPVLISAYSVLSASFAWFLVLFEHKLSCVLTANHTFARDSL